MTTKTDLIDGVADEAKETKIVTKKILDEAFDMITDALADGEKVQISKFGTFDVKETKAHVGRNPKTGEPVHVKAKRRVAFKASNVLKDLI